jgi:hypothetical protein
MLARLTARLRETGIDVYFSGFKEAVIDVLKRTRLYETIGEDCMFPTQTLAIRAIHAKAHTRSTETVCPLVKVVRRDLDDAADAPPPDPSVREDALVR